MKLRRVLLAVGIAEVVAAGPVATAGKFTEQQIIDTVLANPHVMLDRSKSFS
jgi:hypothetical protein